MIYSGRIRPFFGVDCPGIKWTGDQWRISLIWSTFWLITLNYTCIVSRPNFDYDVRIQNEWKNKWMNRGEVKYHHYWIAYHTVSNLMKILLSKLISINLNLEIFKSIKKKLKGQDLRGFMTFKKKNHTKRMKYFFFRFNKINVRLWNTDPL